MKIKTTKQLNLPQLIEYAWENPDLSNGMSILSNDWENVRINFKFNPRGVLSLDILNGHNISDDILFTLKVEEEITEETHLDYLYALTNDDEKEIHRCMNFTIRNASMVIGRNDLTFFTLIDNDLVKIYENGKLVD